MIDYLQRNGRVVTQPVTVGRQGRGAYTRSGLTVVGAVPPAPTVVAAGAPPRLLVATSRHEPPWRPTGFFWREAAPAATTSWGVWGVWWLQLKLAED